MKTRFDSLGVTVASGASVGTAIGAALHHIPEGVAAGAVGATIIGLLIRAIRRRA